MPRRDGQEVMIGGTRHRLVPHVEEEARAWAEFGEHDEGGDDEDEADDEDEPPLSPAFDDKGPEQAVEPAEADDDLDTMKARLQAL